jgi:hypothetical protein
VERGEREKKSGREKERKEGKGCGAKVKGVERESKKGTVVDLSFVQQGQCRGGISLEQ